MNICICMFIASLTHTYIHVVFLEHSRLRNKYRYSISRELSECYNDYYYQCHKNEMWPEYVEKNLNLHITYIRASSQKQLLFSCFLDRLIHLINRILIPISLSPSSAFLILTVKPSLSITVKHLLCSMMPLFIFAVKPHRNCVSFTFRFSLKTYVEILSWTAIWRVSLSCMNL